MTLVAPHSRSLPMPHRALQISGPARPGRRVLSVSGGGLLGVIPAAMLARWEALGRQVHGDGYRLSDSFDLVGGTSTGAIIATAVALGLPAQRIVDFYLVDAPRGFRRRRTAIAGLHPCFDSARLHDYFARATEGRRLRSADLACDLAVVVKSLGDGCPTLLSSHETTATHCLGAAVAHVPLLLSDVLRATTAAPGLFRPKRLAIGPNGSDVACVDGGISPYNDPAELLWAHTRPGTPSVCVTALGTGAGRWKVKTERAMRATPLTLGLGAMRSMITDNVFHTDTVMREAAARSPDTLAYRRLDLPLEAEVLEELGFPTTRDRLRQMRNYASSAGKAALFGVAQVAAERWIRDPLPLRASLQPVRTPCDRAA